MRDKERKLEIANRGGHMYLRASLGLSHTMTLLETNNIGIRRQGLQWYPVEGGATVLFTGFGD